MSYSAVTLDHFHHPRHVGEVEGATGHARCENPACGDLAEFWVRVAEGRLEEVGFRAFGCAAALASCSMLATLARGRTVEEARHLGTSQVLEALEGLPPAKTHGAALAVETLRAALDGAPPP